MKGIKKTVAILLATTMFATVLGGCGSAAGQEGDLGNTTDSTVEAGTETAGADTQGTKTYTMFMRSTYADWIQELKWYAEAEERTGITVDYVMGPEEFDDVYAEVDQRLISSTLPDATMCKLAQSNVYGSQGAFMDLAPLIKEHAPNLQAYLDANPDYTNLITNADGTIYGLPKETPILADFLFVREDHLEKAGVNPASIVTVDDFTEALRTLKAFYGADNTNYYPLSGRDSYVRFQAWFGCENNISKDESNGIYLNHSKDQGFDIMADEAYTMVETMKTWFDEGLINPEWVAGAFSEGDWEAAMLNGDATFAFDYFTRPQWFLDNGGPEADPDYAITVLDYLKDKDGNTMKIQTDLPYNEKLATSINAKVSEDTAITIIQFIDYFYSDEGQVLANWGVEGESFEEVNGKKEFIVDYSTEEATPDGESRWSFLSDRMTVVKPIDSEAFYSWNGPMVVEASNRLYTDDNLFPAYNIIYTDEQTAEITNLVATVFDAEIAGITQFINGSRPLDQWADFQQEMADSGLTRIEEIQLEAFRTTYGE